MGYEKNEEHKGGTMKKIGLFLTIAALIAVGCVIGGTARAEEKETLIRFSMHIPAQEDVSSYAAALYFKNQVEGRTNGKLKVQIFPANQLGSERESLEGLKMGTHQMDYTSSGAVPSFWPPIQCLAMPFLFKNRAVAWHVFDSPFGRELIETMAKETGMRVLGLGENGIRHFVTTKKQIKSPADLKGLKIRTMENPAHMRLVKALGANPTPIAWGELYTAVQQGVVDGYELPLPLIDFAKLYQVSKYVILDGHLYDPGFLWINEAFYQGLSPEWRQIVHDAALEANIVERAQVAFWDEVKALNNLKKNGMVIYTPTDEERRQFRELTQPPVAEFITEQIGPEWTEKLNKAIAEAEEALAKN
jgi:TRAP-type transport system periplasmic protein